MERTKALVVVPATAPIDPVGASWAVIPDPPLPKMLVGAWPAYRRGPCGRSCCRPNGKAMLRRSLPVGTTLPWQKTCAESVPFLSFAGGWSAETLESQETWPRLTPWLPYWSPVSIQPLTSDDIQHDSPRSCYPFFPPACLRDGSVKPAASNRSMNRLFLS